MKEPTQRPKETPPCSAAKSVLEATLKGKKCDLRECILPFHFARLNMHPKRRRRSREEKGSWTDGRSAGLHATIRTIVLCDDREIRLFLYGTPFRGSVHIKRLLPPPATPLAATTTAATLSPSTPYSSIQTPAAFHPRMHSAPRLRRAGEWARAATVPSSPLAAAPLRVGDASRCLRRLLTFWRQHGCEDRKGRGAERWKRGADKGSNVGRCRRRRRRRRRWPSSSPAGRRESGSQRSWLE
jgi:hypothetical protein